MKISEILKKQENGEMSAREIVDGFLDRIDSGDGEIGAFVEVYAGDARLQADAIDKRRADGGALGPLAGVPVAVKSNMLVKGKHVDSASRILDGYIASYDATVVERLIAADAIVIGVTNMDEFACGSSTETGIYGVTRNPVDKSRVAGGSSGGSAAAVAAGFVPVALGSDTGGSIRQPASLCGVVGMKPTYGAVSRYGLMAMSSSLDQIGVFGVCADDVARVLAVIGGHDENDSTSMNVDIALPGLKAPSVSGLKIGVPKQFFGDGLDSAVKNSVLHAIDVFVEAGGEIVELDLPLLDAALAAYYIIMPAELSSNLNRYDGVQYGLQVDAETVREKVMKTRGDGFGMEIKRRALLGTFVLSSGYVDAYYKKAVSARQALRESFDEAFSRVDVIMGPTSPTVAWEIGEKFEDPISMYLADIYTVVANLIGVPAVSMPCGNVDGLPVGLQIIGKRGEDASVLDLVHWFDLQ